MKPTIDPNERRPDVAWLSIAITAVVLSGCVMSTGCASSREGKPSGRSARQVTVLDESFAALKREFNAGTSKPRVLAALLAHLWRLYLRCEGAATRGSKRLAAYHDLKQVKA